MSGKWGPYPDFYRISSSAIRELHIINDELFLVKSVFSGFSLRKVINTNFDTRDYWSVPHLIKVIDKHCPIYTYSAVQPLSASMDWIKKHSFSVKVGNSVKSLSRNAIWKYIWVKDTFSLAGNRLCPVVTQSLPTTRFKTINRGWYHGTTKHQNRDVQNQKIYFTYRVFKNMEMFPIYRVWSLW